jgi:hypothetical protein
MGRTLGGERHESWEEEVHEGKWNPPLILMGQLRDRRSRSWPKWIGAPGALAIQIFTDLGNREESRRVDKDRPRLIHD